MHGHFWGENKRLFFSPPLWYDVLSIGCIFLGGLVVVSGWVSIPILDIFEAFRVAAIFVVVAGLWAMLSSERMLIDLRQRTYTRREGAGPFKRNIRGSLDEIDAIVLIASMAVLPTGIFTNVTYRLVMHWKGNKEPILVLERADRSFPASNGIHGGNQSILARGMRYAKETKVPFFDNSYFASPNPLKPF